MKREVCSWRVSSDAKTSLESEAARRKISVSAALHEAAREWFSKLSSGNARRSETVSEQVRDRLRRRYGR